MSEPSAEETELPDPAELVERLFPRRRVRLIVEADLDPVAGWGHEPDDWRAMLQRNLSQTVGHYKPTVELDAPMTLTTKGAETLAEDIRKAASWWPTPLGGEEARDIAQALIASGAVRREAEVRAEALREAAEFFPGFLRKMWAAHEVKEWLNNRAALAEEGDR